VKEKARKTVTAPTAQPEDTRPIDDPARLESQIRAIPGIVSTGLFLSMADIVLVGDRNDFRLLEGRRRTDSTHGD